MTRRAHITPQRRSRRRGIVASLLFCLALIALPASAATFRDDFNGFLWTNNDGTDNWSTAWFVGGNATLRGTTLAMREEDTEVRRAADLSGYATAQLVVDYATEGRLEGNDRFEVQVSTDASNWTTVAQRQNDGSGIISADITAFISPTTWVRLLIENNTDGGGEYFIIDSVEIVALPPASTVTLIGDYRLDGPGWTGVPGEVVDSSGNGLDGDVVGSPVSSPAYVCNGAEMDGGGYIEIGDNALLDLPDALTAMAWINPATLPSGSALKTILSKDTNYEFHLQNDEIYWWWNTSSGATRTLTTSGANIPIGAWTHVAVVYSRTAAEQVIYINGVPRASDNRGEVLATNGLPLQIGADQGAAGREFEGLIDEVRVYEGGMTQAEVQAAMMETHPCPEPPLTCFTDDFNRASLGTDWAVNSSSGSFGLPRIINGRLRLTDDSNNVATAASLMRLFPGANNKVVLEFDYNAYDGNGADGVAVTFSDAGVTPVPGGYGGSLGYAQRCGIPGFAGGWLGVGIDEYGNFANPTECRSGGTGREQDSVAIRGSGAGTTGYPYVAGTGPLSPGIDQGGGTPGPGHRYRITVDHLLGGGQAFVTVERDTTGSGNNYQEIVPEFDIFNVNPGQSTVPEDWLLSFTGSTGGSTNIHELDNLQVCAARIEPYTTIDHFRFYHDGAGLTCSPENIVVRACMNPDCSVEYTGTVDATLAPTGWVGGDTQSFTSGATLQLWHTTPGTATLGVLSSTPERTPFNQDRCYVGGIQQPDCSMLFRDSGFAFDVPDHAADTPQSVTVRAVRRDDTTQQCVPGFSNVSRDVNFWYEYLNPATGTLDVSVDGVALGGSVPGTARTLAFDANGEAVIEVQYPDAGSMRLQARYEGSAGTDDAGLVMLGQDDFVARPAGFVLDVPGNPAAADATGGVFVQAGADFEVTATAVNASGNPTPNYGREATPESVRLEHALVEPAGGNVGVLDSTTGFGAFGADCDGNPAAAGTACGRFRWDDVGIISFLPGIGDADYLGAGDVTGPLLPRVGRFIPARLGVSASTPQFADACAGGGFTYLGEPFGFDTDPVFTVQGLNRQGNVTANYDAAFWRLATTLAGRTYVNNAAGTSATVGVDTLGSVTEGGISTPPFDGTRTYALGAETLAYAKPATPEAPFDAQVHLDLAASDLTDADGACHDPDQNGVCDGFRLADIGGTELRWGRLALDNAFGSELVDLPVAMRLEYFDGGAFVLNTADSCAAAPLLALSDPDAGDALGTGDTCVLDTGTPGVSGVGCPAAAPLGQQYSATATSGRFNVWLAAPGAPGDLVLGADAPAWLEYDWGGAGAADPAARTSFGIYSGSPRQIYIREVY